MAVEVETVYSMTYAGQAGPKTEIVADVVEVVNGNLVVLAVSPQNPTFRCECVIDPRTRHLVYVGGCTGTRKRSLWTVEPVLASDDSIGATFETDVASFYFVFLIERKTRIVNKPTR